jgi:large-conductance mechanosensitive channel
MNQGARDANEAMARQAAAGRQDEQIKLLREIRDLLKLLLVKDSG